MKERNNKGKDSLPCLKGGGPAEGRWRDSVRGSRCAHRLRNDTFSRNAVGFFVVRRGGALLPTVVPTDSRPLSWPPIGALPRNRLASSATGGASAISPPAGGVEPRPYGSDCRGGRPCPPSPGNATLCRAGPACPAAAPGKKNPPVTALPCRPPLKGAGSCES